jgi:hypothetical protein
MIYMAAGRLPNQKVSLCTVETAKVVIGHPTIIIIPHRVLHSQTRFSVIPMIHLRTPTPLLCSTLSSGTSMLNAMRPVSTIITTTLAHRDTLIRLRELGE